MTDWLLLEGQSNFNLNYEVKKVLFSSRDWCVSRQLWWGHRIPAYYVTIKDRKEAGDQVLDKDVIYYLCRGILTHLKCC